ncbi:hypothetical protein [Vibrio sp. L3-7]|uniref:hypothetical protein n=1 Tax=Vibrio sp. L3-7 TaxID=2912253 RepID=UPI001197289D|nr:hypothetical protein [Vibrio sp. L3-7]MCF7504085.1 hypothetical protein [Vibrio sp. L3-7]TVU67945.1 hypothetical protein FQP87_23075 [Vibrio tasmaniensis]
MDKKDVLDIYREQFAFENDRKKDITAQAQIRFALIATGATLLVYMARNVDLDASLPLLAFFTICSSISAVIFVVVVYKLTDAFWGNEYSYLPPMDETEEYRQSLGNSASMATETFEDYLIEEYSACSGENRKTNKKRQDKLNSIVKWLKASIIPFVLSGGVFLLFDLDSSSSRKVTEIKLIGGGQVSCVTKEDVRTKND